MNKTENAIVYILSAFINNKPVHLDNDVNYNNLYKLSKVHHVDGILGYMDSKCNFCTDKDIKEKLSKSYLSCITVSTNQEVSFKNLCKNFSADNLDLAVFKGYVIRNMYPIPELRSSSDIDILIKPDSREKSHKLMCDNGYETNVDYGEVYSYKKGIEYYELHTKIINENSVDNELVRAYFSAPWDNIINLSDNLYTFDDEYHLMYLVAHIAKHICYGGAGIRMYLDIALFVKNKGDNFDYKKLINTAKTLNFDTFVCTTISTACKWFDIEVPTDINTYFTLSDKISDNLKEFTIMRGLFGNAMSSSGEAVVEKLSKEGARNPRAKALLEIAFPPLKIMKLKHTYLKKAPYLLPVAWIQRGAQNISKIKTKKQKVKDIVSTNNKSVEKHSELIKNIGL